MIAIPIIAILLALSKMYFHGKYIIANNNSTWKNLMSKSFLTKKDEKAKQMQKLFTKVWITKDPNKMNYDQSRSIGNISSILMLLTLVLILVLKNLL